MKITIESENAQEAEALTAPFVRMGVSNIVCTGRIGGDAMRFYSAGDLLEMIGLLSQTLDELRIELHRKSATAGVIDAHNFIVKAQQDARDLAIANSNDLRNGRSLRIHRP